VHISLDDELVKQLDNRVGRRGRSAFIERIVRKALESDRRWEGIEEGFGVLAGREHEWDRDPASWVSAQRHGDHRRVG
jgi:metal-responsive CopG/Arc/MetJ family transcriptional regulator